MNARQQRIDGFKPELIKQAQEGFRMDASNTPFVERFLETFQTNLYEVMRPENSYAKLMTINTGTLNAGSAFYTYGFSDTYGKTKRIQGSQHTTDLPRADFTVETVKAEVIQHGNSYGYSMLELQRAAQSALQGLNVPVDQNRRKAAFRAHQETWNTVALFGSDIDGTKGLFNNTNIPNSAVDNSGTGDSTLWSTKTSQQIYDDIVNAITAVANTTKGVHNVNTLALPVDQYGLIHAKNMGPEGSKTIAKLLKESYPGLIILQIPELEAAFTSDADGFIVYENNSENIEFMVAQGYTEAPPVVDGLGYVISAQSLFLDAPVIRRPSAFLIKTGV